MGISTDPFGSHITPVSYQAIYNAPSPLCSSSPDPVPSTTSASRAYRTSQGIERPAITISDHHHHHTAATIMAPANLPFSMKKTQAAATASSSSPSPTRPGLLPDGRTAHPKASVDGAEALLASQGVDLQSLMCTQVTPPSSPPSVASPWSEHAVERPSAAADPSAGDQIDLAARARRMLPRGGHTHPAWLRP